MKYLQDYMDTKQTELFQTTGTFFAFSNKQFIEQKKSDTFYVNMGAGMFCEKEHVEKLINGLDTIYKEAIQEDLAENGKAKIILRELSNHECFYTGDIDDAVEKLKDYPITKKEVYKAYDS